MKSTRFTRKALSWLLAATAFVSLTACGKRDTTTQATTDERPVSISLQLEWFPEAEYGGIYAAVQQGYYEAAGIDLAVRAGGPHVSPIQIVAGGGATFATGKADSLLLARERGIPVVAIAAIKHTSPQALLFRADQGIDDFTDLNGRTVFFVPGVMGYQYVKHRYNLNVREQVHPGSFVPFINDAASAIHGFAVSEPCDIPGLAFLRFADAGYNTYENVIFTTEKVLQEQPDLVRAFLAATIQGWQYYKDAADEVNGYILQFRPESSLESLACQAKLQEPYIYGQVAEQHGIGFMQEARWDTLREQLIEIGELKTTTQIDGVFTNEFLPTRAK